MRRLIFTGGKAVEPANDREVRIHQRHWLVNPAVKVVELTSGDLPFASHSGPRVERVRGADEQTRGVSTERMAENLAR